MATGVAQLKMGRGKPATGPARAARISVTPQSEMGARWAPAAPDPSRVQVAIKTLPGFGWRTAGCPVS